MVIFRWQGSFKRRRRISGVIPCVLSKAPNVDKAVGIIVIIIIMNKTHDMYYVENGMVRRGVWDEVRSPLPACSEPENFGDKSTTAN